MSIHKELQKRINREKASLEEDKRKVDEAEKVLAAARSDVQKREAYLSGLQEAFRLIPKSEEVAKPVVRNLRPGSLMAKARDAILEAGRPLYVDNIAGRLGIADPKGRVSLAGSMRSYAKKGEIFTVTAPNTFGLIELTNEADCAEHKEQPEEEFYDPFADQ